MSCGLAGCAAVPLLAPDDRKNFCHVAVEEKFGAPEFLPNVYSSSAGALAGSLVSARVSGGTRVPRVTLVELIAFVFAMFTLYGCGAEPVLYGTVLLMLGIPVFVWQRRRSGIPAG